MGNVLYTGQVKVGEEIFPGEHEAIIDQETTFEPGPEAVLEANPPGPPATRIASRWTRCCAG